MQKYITRCCGLRGRRQAEESFALEVNAHIENGEWEMIDGDVGKKGLYVWRWALLEKKEKESWQND